MQQLNILNVLNMTNATTMTSLKILALVNSPLVTWSCVATGHWCTQFHSLESDSERPQNFVDDMLCAIYCFLRICYMLVNLPIGCRQKYLHVAYSLLPIVLKYRTDMLYSGYLGFGGVNLELLSPTTCIYSQNVSTANKHWIWGGLWLCKCIIDVNIFNKYRPTCSSNISFFQP